MMGGTRRAPQQQNAPPPYPLMNIDEIVSCLHALGIGANAEDLTKPNPQTSQAIYAGMLDTLMGAPTEMLEKPRQSLMGMLEYKDLYSDALQFSMFYKHVRHLAVTCGVEDFCMSDLSRPEAKRMQKVLSGFMNFAKFRDERLPFRDQLQAELDDSKNTTLELRQRIDETTRNIAAITAQNEADKPEADRISKENKAIHAELVELKAQQAALKLVMEDIRRERNAAQAEAQARQAQLRELQQEQVSTRSRLVQSPERIKRTIASLSDTVAQEKKSLAEFHQKALEHTDRLEALNALETDVKGYIDLVGGILQNRSQLEEAKRGGQALEVKLLAKKNEKDSLEAREGQLEAQQVNANVRLERQIDARKDQARRFADDIAALKLQYDAKAKERGTWQKEQQRLQNERAGLKEQMDSFVALHEGEINNLMAEYWNMRRLAEDYMNTLDANLELGMTWGVRA